MFCTLNGNYRYMCVSVYLLNQNIRNYYINKESPSPLHLVVGHVLLHPQVCLQQHKLVPWPLLYTAAEVSGEARHGMAWSVAWFGSGETRHGMVWSVAWFGTGEARYGMVWSVAWFGQCTAVAWFGSGKIWSTWSVQQVSAWFLPGR